MHPSMHLTHRFYLLKAESVHGCMRCAMYSPKLENDCKKSFKLNDVAVEKRYLFLRHFIRHNDQVDENEKKEKQLS